MVDEVELSVQIQVHLSGSGAHGGTVEVSLEGHDAVADSLKLVDNGLLLIWGEVLA